MIAIRRFLARRLHKHAVWRLQVARLELAEAKAAEQQAAQRVVDAWATVKSL